VIEVWSPVLDPEILDAPATASVGVAVPDKATELTEVGVIAPKEIVIAGVVVAVATVPETPFAATTLAEVTVPLPTPATPTGAQTGLVAVRI
jgi:hypothetical protein